MRNFFKKMIDITGSVVLAFLNLPLLLLCALIIKATSPGPVIFKQERAGLNGKKFTLYKFRSMISGAEQKRQELIDHNIMAGPAFKMENDPRITPFGRFLRRSSLDEFPQLLNVIKGRMSLVGPRPPLPEEVARYTDREMRRLSVKPGLTCLWQIEGRSNIGSFERWLELDLQYIENQSLRLDLLILIKTIPVVLFRVGAR